MRRRAATIAAICAAAACGCRTSAAGPPFSEARAPPAPEKAVLYVFRKDAKPSAFGATVWIDDREVVTLHQGAFTWTYLSPGRHLVEVRWPTLSGAPDPSAVLSAAPGSTYCFELTGTVPSGAGPAAPVAGIVMLVCWSTFQQSELIVTTPKDAEATMSACCRFEPPALPAY